MSNNSILTPGYLKRRIHTVTFTFLIILLTIGCASKKFAKRANEFAEAGLYKDAAAMYFRSVKANKNNIDAKMGLQRTGQLLLNEKLGTFNTHYKNQATKDAVYSYLDAEKYYNMVKDVGVILIFPEENNVYYDEVKEKYLNEQYSTALQTLDVEDFNSAEKTLNEILSIDPSFKDSKSHWITAKYEPMYRLGNDQFNNELYRTAYYTFDDIIKGTGTYKESIGLKNQSLDSAMITIAFAPFYSPNRQNYGISQNLQKEILKSLNQIKSPFYKPVADPIISSLPQNGIRSRINVLIPYITAYKNKIGAKAILTGTLTYYNQEEGKLNVKLKRGYIKKTISFTDKESGEKKTKTSYTQTNYKEFDQSNTINISFEYSIIDVATKAIIISDVFNIMKDDKINYATFNGNKDELIPGYWKKRNVKSPDDVILDNKNDVSKLKNLISANKSIKNTQTLTQEAIDEITSKMMDAIVKYNPEQ